MIQNSVVPTKKQFGFSVTTNPRKYSVEKIRNQCHTKNISWIQFTLRFISENVDFTEFLRKTVTANCVFSSLWHLSNKHIQFIDLLFIFHKKLHLYLGKTCTAWVGKFQQRRKLQFFQIRKSFTKSWKRRWKIIEAYRLR